MPLTAPGTIEGSVVPTATAAEAPSRRMAGVEITAPPTPNAPDIIPVATPARTVRPSRSGPGSTIGTVAPSVEPDGQASAAASAPPAAVNAAWPSSMRSAMETKPCIMPS